MVAAAPDKTKVNAMVYYYLGYFAEKLGQEQKAAEYYHLAATMPAGLRLPLPKRGHRRAPAGHESQSARRPRALLPGQPAV